MYYIYVGDWDFEENNQRSRGLRFNKGVVVM